MVMTLFFKYLTGNKFALIDISMIRMRNKINSKLIDCNNTSYGWFYGKKLHPKRYQTMFLAHCISVWCKKMKIFGYIRTPELSLPVDILTTVGFLFR